MGSEDSGFSVTVSQLFTGKVVKIYNCLSQEETLDYPCLKFVVLVRYGYVVRRYREKFVKRSQKIKIVKIGSYID